MNRVTKESGLDDAPVELWAITFADLLTLLLCFFVMRFATLSLHSSEAHATIDKIRGGFSKRVGLLPSSTDDNLIANTQPIPDARKDGILEVTSAHDDDPLAPLGGVLMRALLAEAPSGVVEAVDSEGLHLFFSPATFLSDTDQLSFGAADFLSALARTVQNRGSKITVVGNVVYDSTGSQWGSGWELSQAQVLAVVRQLIDAGMSPNVISAAAYGDWDRESAGTLAQSKHQSKGIEILITR